MKTILFSIILCVVQAWAGWANAETGVSVNGRDLLLPFARLCSKDHFSDLVKAFDRSKLLDEMLPIPKLSVTKNQVSTIDGRFATSFRDHVYHLKAAGVEIANADPCAAIVSGMPNRPTSALLRILVTTAYARTDLVNEKADVKGYLIGAAWTAVGIGLSASTGWTGVGAVVGGGTAAFGISEIAATKSLANTRAKLQAVVNGAFTLSCRNGWVKVIGKQSTINFLPTVDQKSYRVSYVQGGKVETFADSTGRTGLSGALLRSIAGTCKNDEDAKHIQRELASDEFRENVAVLLDQGSTHAIEGARSQSIR